VSRDVRHSGAEVAEMGRGPHGGEGAASLPDERAGRKLDRRRRFGTLFDGPRSGRKGVLLPRLDVP